MPQARESVDHPPGTPLDAERPTRRRGVRAGTIVIQSNDRGTERPLAGADVGIVLLEQESAALGRGSRDRILRGTIGASGRWTLGVD